jgi:hypothetical protein
MERQNNMLKEKFESIDDLPLDFTPNLESKWELVAAALPAKKSSKKPLFIWYLGGVAALFLAVISFFWAEPKQDLPIAALTPKVAENPAAFVAAPKKEIAIVKPANKRKTSLKKRGEAPVLVQTKDSILPTMPAITVAENAPEIVKSRYVEIDFTNEVYAAKFPLANTSEKLVQFRFFKPEIGNHTNAQGGVSLLQFKTNF